MKLLEKITKYVHPQRGFLPYPDPILELPPTYSAWDELNKHMPELLQKDDFKYALKNIPQLDSSGIKNGPELDRSMRQLSMFANAYVNWGKEPVKSIPKNLAIPLWEIAHRSGRPPITSHASVVLSNWRKIDPDGPIIPENLKTLQNFLGGVDEDWFYLATVGVESVGGLALAKLFSCIYSVQHNVNLLVKELYDLSLLINDINKALEKMYTNCRPEVFYNQVRPFLRGWPDSGIIYKGVKDDDPKVFIGGSAAQSSLLQALDAGLGIFHPSNDSGPFLMQMRKYMPVNHRKVISLLESEYILSNYIKNSSNIDLDKAYDKCVSCLEKFRKKHLKMAIHYISDQENKIDEGEGTGGTKFITFLNTTKDETRLKGKNE
ncbi:MAG: hypothetical protein CMG74_09235 [Candidatus Marinimicrobia bacterium]|nr:hypothetical protein [Candidatus Neomarinimicrobiota bacterium]|tara:strand:+ start:2218 stop:3348 length:1131 start_codon:yes stop_codon:yes gene_type:complete